MSSDINTLHAVAGRLTIIGICWLAPRFGVKSGLEFFAGL
jgi:hypothetical protein